MIRCVYCGYECPDTAHICPNCGKPIVRGAKDKEPTFEDIKEALRHEKNEIKNEASLSEKQIVLAASVVLLLAFIAMYTFF